MRDFMQNKRKFAINLDIHNIKAYDFLTQKTVIIIQRPHCLLLRSAPLTYRQNFAFMLSASYSFLKIPDWLINLCTANVDLAITEINQGVEWISSNKHIANSTFFNKTRQKQDEQIILQGQQDGSLSPDGAQEIYFTMQPGQPMNKHFSSEKNNIKM